MKKIIFFTLVLLLIPNSYAKPLTSDQLSLTKPIQSFSIQQKQLIDKHLKTFPEQTEIALALIEKGEVNFYGFRKEADEWKKVHNQDRVFEIGSMTKVFTATLLADQRVKNVVEFDDNINEFLKIELKNDIQIPIGSLANHTSGLPRLPDNLLEEALLTPDNPYQNYTEEELETYLTQELKLLAPPGEKMEYSNLGAGILAYMLKQLSGQTYQTLLEEIIFKPYRMDHSTTEKAQIQKQLVPGLNAEGQPTANWDFGALTGAGGIYSSAEDLAKFAVAQFDPSNRALALTQKKTFESPEGLGIGLGWFILPAPSGGVWHWHNGGTGGYTASIVLDFEKKNAVILLSNVSAYHPSMNNIDALGFELMESFEEE